MSGNRRTATRRAVGLLLATVLLGACSSGEGDEAASADSGAASTTAVASAPTCEQGATTDDIEVEAVAKPAYDRVITSFDDTKIRVHWFPAPGAADKPAPTVLMGPGWSLAGATQDSDIELFGALSIGSLNDDAYNVLTWDPRGFGKSGGVASVNDPKREGRDVQILLDWVAEQPEAELDATGDPRAGMIGASYGGGIQLTVASIDCRVDALVPNMAWHSLKTSLYPNKIVKEGWAGKLVSIGGDNLDPHITSAAKSGLNGGTLSDEDYQWFLDRGPGDQVSNIGVPTLLLAGTVDTLFALQESVANYESLSAAGTPVHLMWYCGGHGVCLTSDGNTDRVTEATTAWLARYLKDDTSVDLGSPVEVVDQNDQHWLGDDYPTADQPGSGTVTGNSDGSTLKLTADSQSGPLPDGAGKDLLGGLVTTITPYPVAADQAVEAKVTAKGDVLVVGAPKLTMTYSGTTPGEASTHVFAQLVDPETNTVVGNQITPVPVTLDGEEHTAEVDLEIIAQHMLAKSSLTLQVVASTGAYAKPELGGEIDVSSLNVSLPTTTELTEA